jgi:two-component sensor histidine kinase
VKKKRRREEEKKRRRREEEKKKEHTHTHSPSLPLTSSLLRLPVTKVMTPRRAISLSFSLSFSVKG